MSYSSNPLLPKARAEAVRLVVEQKLPVGVAARRSGIHRTTLWRWYKQWTVLNAHIQLENSNRPNRQTGSQFRLSSCRWLIPTKSSRPHAFGRVVHPDVVARIQYYRMAYGRCAAIVHAYCLREGTQVSLSTVRRVLHRLGLVTKRKWHRRRALVPRPTVSKPGDLVQTDTVHLTSTFHGKRRVYLYTAIDVHSRWAYAEYHTHISEQRSVQFLARAEAYAGFHFACVQADNGSEFGRVFESCLKARGTRVRHSRVRRPNDNAYVERFNRTIQEECLGRTLTHAVTNKEIQGRLTAYLDFYHTRRVHLGLQLRTPLEMLQRS